MLFLLALLQIVTESLPISSSGHVLLLEHLLRRTLQNSLFEILDHLSYGVTLLMVAILFWSDWTSLLAKIISFTWARESYRRFISIVLRIIAYVFIVDFITIIGFYIFRELLKGAIFLQSPVMLFLGFVVTTVGLLSLAFLPIDGMTHVLDTRRVFVIGLVQAIAFLPGISRFASVYVASRWLGLSARRAMQFQFLVYVPLMAALFCRGVVEASFCPEISLFYSVYHGLAVILTTVVGYYVLRMAYHWGLSGTFWRFGIYMIFVSAAALFQALYCYL